MPTALRSPTEIVDDATRRQFIAMLAAAGLLAACGDDDDGAAAITVPTTTTRIVGSAFGEVELPSEPARLVVDWVTFDNLLAIDFDLSRVAGVFSLDYFLTEPDTSPHIAKAAIEAKLSGVGEAYEPNLERLLAIEPDLILVALDQIDESFLDRFREAAPVVAYEMPAGHKSFEDWRSSLRATAAVLGGDAVDAAEAYVAGFEQRVAEFTADHADLIDGVEVTVGNIVADNIRVSMPGRNIGTNVIADLGLARPAVQVELNTDPAFTFEVSPERIDVLDADILFLEQRQDSVAFLDANPLWLALPAVQADRVHFVPNYWEFGGAGSAGHALDDVIAALQTMG